MPSLIVYIDAYMELQVIFRDSMGYLGIYIVNDTKASKMRTLLY